MTVGSSHFVVFWVTTNGKNGTDLGTDEAQIILLSLLIFDASSKKIVETKSTYVRPQELDIENNNLLLTEECRALTKLTDETIQNAAVFSEALKEVDNFLNSKPWKDNMVLLTDGQAHIRQVMFPESQRKNLVLPSYYSKFFDIRKEFKKCYKNSDATSIEEMLLFMKLKPQEANFGDCHVRDISNILSKMLSDGHRFTEPEVVTQFEPCICKETYVDDETVIRARGLPWQTSDDEIADFFRGLNIVKGGVGLCLGPQGRRNGEALVRFENQEQRDLALRRHKHHMGGRYIEIYRATGHEYLSVAIGHSPEAVVFLNKGGEAIIRMRGLPYTTTIDQVEEFFLEGEHPVKPFLGSDGILFVRQPNGRATGDAFVLFETNDDADKALTRHRECIGTRYIELFKSTIAEVQQVLTRSQEPKPASEASANRPGVNLPLLPHVPHEAAPAPTTQQNFVISGSEKNCVRLRGLPPDASVHDLLIYLGEFAQHIVIEGVHMIYTIEGRPSGEAFIQMESETAAEMCALSRHLRILVIGYRQYPIEVYQCSGDDMNFLLSSSSRTDLTPSTPNQPSPVTPKQLQLSPSTAPTIVLGGNGQPSLVYQAIPTAYSQLPQLVSNNTAAPTTVSTSLQSTSPTSLTQSTISPSAVVADGSRPFQLPLMHPVLYWYPTPPVSPQQAQYFGAPAPGGVAPSLMVLQAASPSPGNGSAATLMETT